MNIGSCYYEQSFDANNSLQKSLKLLLKSRVQFEKAFIQEPNFYKNILYYSQSSLELLRIAITQRNRFGRETVMKILSRTTIGGEPVPKDYDELIKALCTHIRRCCIRACALRVRYEAPIFTLAVLAAIEGDDLECIKTLAQLSSAVGGTPFTVSFIKRNCMTRGFDYHRCYFFR